MSASVDPQLARAEELVDALIAATVALKNSHGLKISPTLKPFDEARAAVIAAILAPRIPEKASVKTSVSVPSDGPGT